MRKSPSKLKRERNKELAVKFYLEGNTLDATAQKVNQETGQTISYATVSRYLDEALAQWKTEKLKLVDNHKDFELARINKLEVEAWSAWFASKGGVNVTSEKEKGPKEGTITLLEKGKSKKETFGDARYLDLVKWCIEQRCKILGVEAPAVVEVNQTTTSTNTTVRRIMFRTRKQIQEGRAGQTVEASLETQKED